MTDADLIYNALLRAERRLEKAAGDGAYKPVLESAALIAIQTLREEIGNGLGGRRAHD